MHDQREREGRKEESHTLAAYFVITRCKQQTLSYMCTLVVTILVSPASEIL